MKIIRLIPKTAKTIKKTETPSDNEKEAEGVGATSPSSQTMPTDSIQSHPAFSDLTNIGPKKKKKKRKRNKNHGFFPRSMPYSS